MRVMVQKESSSRASVRLLYCKTLIWKGLHSKARLDSPSSSGETVLIKIQTCSQFRNGRTQKNARTVPRGSPAELSGLAIRRIV
jgi:hypothetical protein